MLTISSLVRSFSVINIILNCTTKNIFQKVCNSFGYFFCSVDYYRQINVSNLCNPIKVSRFLDFTLKHIA